MVIKKIFGNLAGRIRLKTWIALGIILVLSPIVLWTLFKPMESGATWFNDNWMYRKKITIDDTKVSGSTNFTDFPVLINQATDSDLAAKAQADGDDILFTDINGRKLDHEIERYTSGTGELVAWVKVPTLYATEDTVLYMYYGNPSVANQQSPGDVWDSNFVMVQHLQETTTGASDFKDSTYYNNDSSAVTIDGAGSNADATGKVDGAIQFDGSDDYINVSDNESLEFTGDLTVSTWLNIDQLSSTLGHDQNLVRKDAGSSGSYWFNIDTDNTLKFLWRNSTLDLFDVNHNTALDADDLGTWIQATAVKSGTTLYIYVNGSDTSTGASRTTSGSNLDTANPLRFASEDASTSQLDGYLDEIRMSKTARSADWIATDYATQNHLASAFYSMDSQETTPGPIAYWKFDEGVDNTCQGGEDACDSTSNANDGTFGASTAAPTWQTEDVCVFGKCLYFDGTDDVVTVANTVSGVKTVSFWAKVMSTSTTEQLIDLNGTDYITSTSGTVTANEFGTETIYVDGQTGTTLTANRWHHVVVTTSSSLSASAIKIGQISTNYGNAFIDEVKLYPYARSAAQVKVDYANGAAVLGAKTQEYLSEGLVGYWKMDEASGTSAADASGSGYDMTLANAQETGTAEADSSTTVIVDDDNANLATANDAYNNMIVRITGAEGDCGIAIGTERQISDYVYDATPTREITVSTAFAAQADNCIFEIRHQVRGKFGLGTAIDTDDSLSTNSQMSEIWGVSQITVSFWAKPNSQQAWNSYFTQYSDDNNNTRIQPTDTSGQVRMYVSNGSTAYGLLSNAYSTGVWNHIAMVFDGTKEGNANRLKAYVNGVQTNFDSFTGTIPSTTFNASADTTISAGIDAVMDEYRIYNRALSEKEVRDLYNWAPGPIGYWNMDENKGTSTVYDRSGSANTHNATMNGSMTEDDWVPGKVGPGLDFDGSDDRLTVTDHDDFAPTAITGEAWVKFNSLPSTNSQDAAILLQSSGSIPYNGLAIWGESSNDQFACAIGLSDTSEVYQYSGSAASVGVWYHVACSWDGTTQKLYVNGIQQDSDSLSGPTVLNSTEVLELGGHSEMYAKAVIDEAKIYNYARTPGQIIEDMNAGHPSPGSPIGSPIGYWKFDEGVDNTCSGGSNDVCNSGSQGTTLDGTSTATRYSAGKVGQALDFDADNDVVTVTNSTAIDLNNGLSAGFTISAWIYADSDGEGDAGQIFSKSGNISPLTYLRVSGQSGSNLNLDATVDLSSTAATLSVTAPITTGAWNYVALSYTDDADDEISIWVNGIKRGTSSDGVGSPSAEGNNFLIGNNPGGTATFEGRIDEVKIYDSELTEDQIKIDYEFGSAVNYGTSTNDASDLADGAGNGPVGYWPLDENTGTTAYDRSGSTNTYNGTINDEEANAHLRWRPGKFGSAIKFDDNDYTDFGDINEIDEASAYTISAWLYERSFQSWAPILIKNDDGNTGIFVTYGETTGTLGTCLYINSGADGDCGYVSTYPSGEWFHFETVFDGSKSTNAEKLKMYINGVLQTLSFDSTVPTATAATADGFQFGWNSYETTFDEIKVYDYARTAAQVAYDYNRGGPVGYWKFDECQGATAYDSSEQGNNGTITTGGSVGTCAGSSGEMWYDGATGKYNSSLDFSGAGDWVDMNDQSELDFGDGEDLSVCAWIKRDDADNEDTIVAKANSQTSQGYVLYIDSANDDINFAVSDDTPDTFSVNGTSTISTGTWYHVCGVFDESSATNSTIYINGQADKEGTSGTIGDLASLTNAVDFRIGSESDDGEPFDGLIDDVRVYRYALSAAQVRNIMNQSAVRFGPDTGSP